MKAMDRRIKEHNEALTEWIEGSMIHNQAAAQLLEAGVATIKEEIKMNEEYDLWPLVHDKETAWQEM